MRYAAAARGRALQRGVTPRFYSTPRNTEPTAPSGVPLRRIFEPTFPLPLRDSFSQWRNRNQLKRAESELLEIVGLEPGVKTGSYTVQSLDVPVTPPLGSLKSRGQHQQFMNELEVTNTEVSAEDARHTVLVHGYGAAKGFFYQNFKTMADFGTLHALDWLGYGLSDRVDVRLPKFTDPKAGVLYAENYFVTALESWRAQRGINKFTLVAHSLGAPISCAYAKRFPERVEKIVFVSPASVNRTPYSIPASQLYKNESDPPKEAPVTGRQFKVPPWFAWLWEQHYSPFFLVRAAGPWGPKLTSGWTARRFRALPERDQHALQVYTYTMFNAKGSGEYMLNYFLTAGSSGRWPMVERLRGLECPSLWLYGDRDWMDVNGGLESVKRLQAMGQRAELKVVSESGHHLYLDSISEFNGHLKKFLETW